MNNERNIAEKFLLHVWDKQHIVKEGLRDTEGRKIEVISPGRWNSDSGPDFLAAKIKYSDQRKTVTGDIEIHLKASEWRTHGHHLDPRYNNVIFHVVMWKDIPFENLKKENGELLPTLAIHEYLDSSIERLTKKFKQLDTKVDRQTYLCKLNPQVHSSQDFVTVIDQLGEDRLFQRVNQFKKRMNSVSVDQVIYEGIMEALGFSKNETAFQKLAQISSIDTINTLIAAELPNKCIPRIQAYLFGVAGLLPSQSHRRIELDEDTIAYVSLLELIWKNIDAKFKTNTMSNIEWQFFRTRPLNFPTKRIAGMCYFLINNYESNFFEKFLTCIVPAQVNNISKICEEVQKFFKPEPNDYWITHCNFGGRKHSPNLNLIGKERISDIIINVLIPIGIAYTRTQQQNDISYNALFQIYHKFPKLEENDITRLMKKLIFGINKRKATVINSAKRQQGIIHIFKNYCEKLDCENCVLNQLTK